MHANTSIYTETHQHRNADKDTCTSEKYINPSSNIGTLVILRQPKKGFQNSKPLVAFGFITNDNYYCISAAILRPFILIYFEFQFYKTFIFAYFHVYFLYSLIICSQLVFFYFFLFFYFLVFFIFFIFTICINRVVCVYFNLC